MTPLYRKYRPKTLDDIVGQDKAVEIIRKLEPRGLGGRLYWLQGKSGRGKTTLARIIATKVCGDQGNITETTGRQLTRSMLDSFTDQYRYYGKPFKGMGTGYTLIVNEAHGLSKPLIEVFLNLLETIPPYVVIIFTTTIRWLFNIKELKERALLKDEIN